jgi:aminopeptidase N
MQTIPRVRRWLLVSSLVVACSDPASPPPTCSVACDGGSSDAELRDAVPIDARPSDGSPADAPSGGYEAKSYEVVGRFDWQERKLIAKEHVILVKTSGGDYADLDAAVDVKGITGDSGASLPFVVMPNLLRIDVSSLAGASQTMSFFIEYEARTSDALVTSKSRDDDPVEGRVVYTDSEPNAGMKWLPAIHRPADRAEFAVELTVAADEDVVANGERTKDEMRGGAHVVRYEIPAIPTYTMAFAAGDIERRERTTGRVPIAVWFRRGLAFQPDEMLDFLSAAMSTYEQLLGAYPWSRYAVVLLPEFSGGMENTTVTFTSETSGQANLAANLHAHELAHHWFGDWVTVATFDDVWIKEGMATLLAPEAERARRDAEKKGRLFGIDFDFSPNEAIRDRSLTGLDKYNSGPYQRAAWLLTQIRERMGEDAFWQSLRHVLKTYALGSIDSDTFVRSFALDDDTTRKVLLSLDEKRSATVTIGMNADPAGTRVELNLNDPGGTMIAPTVVTVVDATGQTAASTLAPDLPLELVVPTGGYMAPDEKGIHPDWQSVFSSPEDPVRFASLLFPSSEAARAAFATRSAAHQERAIDAALGYLRKIDVEPGVFTAFYGDLDSMYARRSTAIGGCYAASSNALAWTGVLGPLLAEPALTSASTAYGACGVDFATRTFAAEMANLAAGLDARSAKRFIYLSSFDYGPSATFDLLSGAALSAPSLQLRDQALNRLSWQVTGSTYSPLATAEDRTRWKDLFRGRLGAAKSATRFSLAWRTVVALRDDGALVTAGTRLQSVPLPEATQRNVVCDAYKLAQSTRPEAWKEFQDAAQPWDALSASARAALASGGATCVP